ncbi:MAG: DUF2791 family P-loop domain-containing protein [Verrucomicrobiales bacterium]
MTARPSAHRGQALGSGKVFFSPSFAHAHWLQKKLVVARADFSMERRLWKLVAELRSLYTELMRNLATKAQLAGALVRVLALVISKVQHEVMSAGIALLRAARRIASDLRKLANFVGGFEFAEVVRAWYRGQIEKNDALQLLLFSGSPPGLQQDRTPRAGCGAFIDDDSIYESLKLMAAFVRKAGYGGLLVGLDEMVVLSHRLPHSRARQANYEALLTILNDCVQGSARGLGFLLAGTDECLEDKRRGLFSYEALRSRLAENTLAKQQGLIDLSGPVIRLQPLTPEDLFVLLKNVALVHAGGDPAKIIAGDEAIAATLHRANETLGAEFFRTPRDVVRAFVGLLNLLDQNPSKTWKDLLGTGILKKADSPMSEEEALATGVNSAADDEDDDLTTIKL